MSIVELEHESGLRPLGEYSAHCHRCHVEAARRERAATCEHGQTDEVATLAGVVRRWCHDCGTPLPIEGGV